MASKLKAGYTVADINVTPMVDVMLVLLIIFMVITPMLQKGTTVDLAKTRNPRAMAEYDRDDAVRLAITRDGTIYFMDDRIRRDEITIKVKDRIASKLDKMVYLKADARAKYGDVAAVVENIQAAGVDNLGLITERIERQAPGAGAPAPTP
jgi:biopolymer transport protein ExbD/biopolymer transport protein TolR